MKHAWVFGLLSLMACAPAVPKGATVAGDIQADIVRPSGDSVPVLKVGQVLEIELQGNASTGYQWQLVEDGSPVVTPATPPTSAATSDKPAEPVMVGAPSTSRWWFQAAQPGRTTVRLVYRRPWEKDVPPARTADYRVEVE
jgi:predicted secreted protein